MIRMPPVIIEALPPEICQQCGKLDELRPYGKRQDNGARLWICFRCMMLDEEEGKRAFNERFDEEGSV
jgi:hypothetical protein